MGIRTYTFGLLLGLALHVNAADNITDDSYFYGQSPPIYPSRMFYSNSACFWLTDLYLAKGSGAGDWQAAYQKAKAFVGKLTAEEKVNLTAGTFTSNGCSGNIAPIPRLDFPGFCVSDAGNGLVSSNQLNSVSAF